MEHLLINHYETAAVILFGIGFLNLLLQNNLVKKVIGVGIMDSSVYLFWHPKAILKAAWLLSW